MNGAEFSNFTGEGNFLNQLITTLESEITFLRNKVVLKDKIIEMLMKESSINYQAVNVPSMINDEWKSIPEGQLCKSQNNNPNKRNPKNDVKFSNKFILVDNLNSEDFTQVNNSSVTTSINIADKSLLTVCATIWGQTWNLILTCLLSIAELIIGGPNESASQIANDIINLASGMKNDINIVISSILTRKDKLNSKGIKVNEHLEMIRAEKNFGFIDNSNI